MAKLIRLSAKQNKVAHIKHPALDGCKKYTSQQIDDLALKGDKDALFLSLRSSLRYLVGRYLAHYRRYVERYVEDMISEGFAVIAKFVNDLDNQPKDGILDIVHRRIQEAIEVYLNRQQALGPNLRNQRKKTKPLYITVTANADIAEAYELRDEGDVYKRDVMEALEALEPKDRIDAYLLNPIYWGKKEKDMAKLLGVDQATINRRKKSLYRQYLEVTR